MAKVTGIDLSNGAVTSGKGIAGTIKREITEQTGSELVGL
ncbi:hypothetical protein ABIB40_000026 [Pedobacter sp. UYP30]